MHLEAVAHAHAAAFIGRTPWDVSRDPALLTDAHATAWRCYGQRQVSPLIAPHLAEAEAWGQELAPIDAGEDMAPAAPLFDAIEKLTDLPPLDPKHARLADLLDAAGRLANDVRATVAVPVSGPFAIAQTMLGRESLLRALADKPELVAKILREIARQTQPWIHAIGEARRPIAIHEADYDPDIVSPDLFERVLAPALNELVDLARRATREAPSLFIDGDTASIAAVLGRGGAGYINCPDTTAQTAFLMNVRKFPDVTVRVDLPRDLWLGGNWQAVCGEIASRAGVARLHAQTVLGTGPLPVRASSVLVVDACHFTTNMDPWLEPG